MRSKILLQLLFTFFLMPEDFLISQIKFAVIGDYGDNRNIPHPGNVAAMINSMSDIEFIVTIGDNYYGGEDDDYNTSWEALDGGVGRYYSKWIGNYQGNYFDMPFTYLINMNDSWKYLVNQSVSDWETEGFDDTNWDTGDGVFGVDTDLGYLTFNTPLASNIHSFFFRKTFDVTNPSAVTELFLDLLYDDGVSVFINGVEAYQAGGLSGSPPDWDASGATPHEAEYYVAIDFNAMISNLNTGENTIAVGVWNTSLSSTDIVFDAQLRISYSDRPDNSTNKFFPALGNHDWYHEDSCKVYTDYFTLPGNERYYDFVRGNVHFFMLSNYGVGVEEYNGEWSPNPRHGNYGEPDGVSQSSIQGQWLENQLNSCVNSSDNHWRVVVGHYPPYKGNKDDPTARWPYKDWGAHIFFSAHDHFYQVLEVDNFPYIINGVGGTELTNKSTPAGIEIFYEKDYGACIVEAQANDLVVKFYNEDGVLRNTYQVTDVGLPVELAFFTGVVNGKKVELRWRTETEVNNYGFFIERSEENTDWSVLGFVEGYGNSNSPKEYSFIDTEIYESGNYYYRLKQTDNDGTFEYSNIETVTFGVPVLYYLSQNYPNPSNPETRIDYTIPKQQNVSLRVYNMLGEMVTELVNEIKPAGTYTTTFDASNLPSGIYVYRLETESFSSNRKMTVLK